MDYPDIAGKVAEAVARNNFDCGILICDTGIGMSIAANKVKGIRAALTPEEKIKQQRTLMQEILRNVGLKVQPIDVDIQESYSEWDKKKALKALLQEAGVVKDFSIPYIPKR